MIGKFKTVLNEGMAEIVEKKSRFIANVCPVKTEEEARAFIETMKKTYWDARHNVFAYQIGERNEIQRFSDDGEPQGTAGMPVLTVLSGEDIKNCCIVVTRYFGGTLLGTGGLVRAYGRCAKAGVLDAGIAMVNTYIYYSILTEYTMQGKIQYEIMQGEYIVKDTVFTDTVKFFVLVEEEKGEEFQKRITDISAGQAEIRLLDTVHGAWVKGKFVSCN